MECTSNLMEVHSDMFHGMYMEGHSMYIFIRIHALNCRELGVKLIYSSCEGSFGTVKSNVVN